MNSFNLRIVDQKKLMVRLLISIVLSLFLIPVVLLLLPKPLTQNLVFFVLVPGILATPLLVYLVVQSAYKKDVVTLSEETMQFNQFGVLKWEEMQFAKLVSKDRLYILMKSKQKITLVAENQFSKESKLEFELFFQEFRSRFEASRNRQ